MSTVVVDVETGRRLVAAGGPTVVRDEDGRLLGRFEAEPVDRTVSLDEMRRRARAGGRCFTPDEVMARLRALS